LFVKKGLLMAYKLSPWRRRGGAGSPTAHLLPLVRGGMAFVDGVQQATKGRRAGVCPAARCQRDDERGDNKKLLHGTLSGMSHAGD
jgi:hypothetical protein